MPLYSNRDLSRDLSATTRAIVVQHGHGRDAAAYFSTVAGLISEIPQAAEDVLLLAPQFFVRGEAHAIRGRGRAWRSAFDVTSARAASQPRTLRTVRFTSRA